MARSESHLREIRLEKQLTPMYDVIGHSPLLSLQWEERLYLSKFPDEVSKFITMEKAKRFLCHVYDGLSATGQI